MASKKENRDVRLFIRVTPEELDEIKKNQDKAGLRLSEYARRLLMGEVVVAAPPANLNILIREIKRVGSNLHQVLHKLNVLGIAHGPELDQCAIEIHEVLHLICQTYRPGKGDG